MTVRLAAALLILLSACASSIASPIGVLAGPFAGQVLDQQRQQAGGKAAAGKPKVAAAAICIQEQTRELKRPAGDVAATPSCELPAGDAVAARNRPAVDPLPEPDKKRGAE